MRGHASPRYRCRHGTTSALDSRARKSTVREVSVWTAKTLEVGMVATGNQDLLESELRRGVAQLNRRLGRSQEPYGDGCSGRPVKS